MSILNENIEIKNVLDKFITPKDTWTSVEKALFTPNIFFKNYKKNLELILPAIKYSFRHHYENNFIYKKLCDINKVNPDKVKTFDDIKKIPLLPDSYFKDYTDSKEFLKWLNNVSTGALPKLDLKIDKLDYDDIIEQFNLKGISIMFTSGTSGKFSFIPRSSGSWNRLKYNAIKSFVELMDYNRNDSGILLIPDPRQTNLTIASLFGIAFDLYKPENISIALEDTKITVKFLRMQKAETIGIKEKIQAKAIAKLSPLVQKKSDQKMISLLERFEKSRKRTIIAGPPFWLNRILDKMNSEGKTINLPNSQVLTGGGWKVEEDKRSPEESFREKVHDILGIPHERFHDVYAMTECSSVFLSCEGHYKHIPPTIIPFVLDEDLNQRGYNEFGRFAFIDPIPDTYPGFIITGDKVRIIEHCPICNREGPVLDIEVTRIPGSEGRGCAAVMAELIEQKE